MLNIPELERRWFHYKLKSYIPHATIFIALIVIVTITTIVMIPTTESNHNIETTVVAQKRAIETPPKVEKVEVPKSIIKRAQEDSFINNKGTTLVPSMNFIKKMENDSQPYYGDNSVKKIENSQKEPAVEVKKNVQKRVTQSVMPMEVEEEVALQPVINKITIKRKNRDKDILDIIKRFKKNNNPALSLFIAKKYYEQGNYHQSYNYALITNQINSKIEASWIIFVKSLVKLGKTDMAIKTLKDYIRQSQSTSAQTLLDEIILGKFK